VNYIGFSVIYSLEQDEKFYATLLEDMLATGCRAIELHTPHHNEIESPILLKLINKFDYRAIHTSDLRSPSEDQEILLYYKKLAQRIDAAAITIHPHTMQTWDWVANYFGDLASFENMDRFKPFGKSPEDMKHIQEKCPTARWTFDLNHVFTNDSLLRSVPDFYTQLDNLGHYHISGFQDELLPHTTLHTTKQDAIIQAVATNHPIIIESLGIKDIHLFREEYDCVVKRLPR
jgi:hypothetical protein